MAEKTPTQDAPPAAPLDYRAHYAANALPVPQFNAPAYPLPQQNPGWTLGKILMATGGTVAVLGLSYWAYTAIKKAKAQSNPVRQLHVAPQPAMAPQLVRHAA